MADIPQNKTYKAQTLDMGKVATGFKNIAARMGPRQRTAPPRQRTSAASTINKYKDLSGQVSTELQKLGRISVPYGGSTKYEDYHPAIDIANKYGTPIPFYSSGKVTEVVRGKKQGDPWSGNYVVIVDNQGNSWRYSHLSNSYVQVGDIVSKGDVALEMGDSGYTYSPSGGDASHLDLRIRDAYGKHVNPMNYL